MKVTLLKNDQKGFSLVELMIVVAIIGILASLAVPRFQSFQAKARAAEASTSLTHIYTLQQAYHGDNDSFAPVSAALAPTIPSLGFAVQGKARYNYALPISTPTTFVARAASSSATILGTCQTAVHDVRINHHKIFGDSGLAAATTTGSAIPAITGC